MAENSVLQKAAQALVEFITAGLDDSTLVYNMKSAQEKEGPYVGCGAEESSGEDIGTGNSAMLLMVKVKYRGAVESDGVDPKTASDTLTARVFELLRYDNLAEQLTDSLADFTCFGFFEDGRESIEQDGDFFVETWTRRAYCAGASF